MLLPRNQQTPANFIDVHWFDISFTWGWIELMCDAAQNDLIQKTLGVMKLIPKYSNYKCYSYDLKNIQLKRKKHPRHSGRQVCHSVRRRGLKILPPKKIWVFPKIGGTPKWMVKIMEKPYENGWFGGKNPLFSKTSKICIEPLRHCLGSFPACVVDAITTVMAKRNDRGKNQQIPSEVVTCWML